MLSKTQQVDVIEIVNDNVQVRTKTTIMDGDEIVSTSYHRKVISPGDDYSSEDTKVQSVCSLVHTPEVVAEYLAAQKAVNLID